MSRPTVRTAAEDDRDPAHDHHRRQQQHRAVEPEAVGQRADQWSAIASPARWMKRRYAPATVALIRAGTTSKITAVMGPLYHERQKNASGEHRPGTGSGRGS